MCKFLKKTKDRFQQQLFILDFFITKIMKHGNRGKAKKIIILFFNELKKNIGYKKNTFKYFLDALLNVSPTIKQIFEFDFESNKKIYKIENLTKINSIKKGITFFINSSKFQKGTVFYKKLVNEIMDAYSNKGKSVQKKNEYEKKILNFIEALEQQAFKQKMDEGLII